MIPPPDLSVSLPCHLGGLWAEKASWAEKGNIATERFDFSRAGEGRCGAAGAHLDPRAGHLRGWANCLGRTWNLKRAPKLGPPLVPLYPFLG